MHRWLWASFHGFYKGRKHNGDRLDNAPELEERLNTEIRLTPMGRSITVIRA
ncbi:hypothetical protein QT972_21140 [Microcoleus sp. herbarium7]|uniref:hypothetical protein n=1 Tax=Microcoleus sp. herbarium7 TaxID=3055435 RepID=UPI002FD5658C